MDEIEFIFSEFCSPFKPNKENILKYFPQAKITEYNETNTKIIFPESDPRRLWKMGDYSDWVNIIKSEAEVAVSIDADLEIVDERVKGLIPLVKKFNFVVAASGRHLVSIDTKIGTDSDGLLDETLGTGFAVCNGFVACNPRNENVRKFFSAAVKNKIKYNTRGPLVFWRTMYETGIYPYLLPIQWCVCADHLGIGDEIILHLKDEKVREYYSRKFHLTGYGMK